MKYVENVQGSKQMAVETYIGKNRVDIHTNIQEVEVVDPVTKEKYVTYQYDEMQYSKDEYLAMLREENEMLKELVCDQDLDLEAIKEALCDLDK